MDNKKQAFIKFMNNNPDYYKQYYVEHKEHLDEIHKEYVKNNYEHVQKTAKEWREKNEKPPKGKLMSKRSRIERSLMHNKKRADAFRAYLNDIKEDKPGV